MTDLAKAKQGLEKIKSDILRSIQQGDFLVRYNKFHKRLVKETNSLRKLQQSAPGKDKIHYEGLIEEIRKIQDAIIEINGFYKEKTVDEVQEHWYTIFSSPSPSISSQNSSDWQRVSPPPSLRLSDSKSENPSVASSEDVSSDGHERKSSTDSESNPAHSRAPSTATSSGSESPKSPQRESKEERAELEIFTQEIAKLKKFADEIQQKNWQELIDILLHYRIYEYSSAAYHERARKYLYEIRESIRALMITKLSAFKEGLLELLPTSAGQDDSQLQRLNELDIRYQEILGCEFPVSDFFTDLSAKIKELKTAIIFCRFCYKGTELTHTIDALYDCVMFSDLNEQEAKGLGVLLSSITNQLHSIKFREPEKRVQQAEAIVKINVCNGIIHQWNKIHSKTGPSDKDFELEIYDYEKLLFAKTVCIKPELKGIRDVLEKLEDKTYELQKNEKYYSKAAVANKTLCKQMHILLKTYEAGMINDVSFKNYSRLILNEAHKELDNVRGYGIKRLLAHLAFVVLSVISGGIVYFRLACKQHVFLPTIKVNTDSENKLNNLGEEIEKISSHAQKMEPC